MDSSSFLSSIDTFDFICIVIVVIFLNKCYSNSTSKHTALDQNLADGSNPFGSRHQGLSHDEVRYNGFSSSRSDRIPCSAGETKTRLHSGQKSNTARGAEPQKIGSAKTEEKELSQETIEYMKLKARFMQNNAKESAVHKQANEQPKIPVSSQTSVPKGPGSKSLPSGASDTATKTNLPSNAAPTSLSGSSSPSKKKATSVSAKSQGWQSLF